MPVFILHFRVFVALNVFANIKTLICKHTRILLERLLTSMVPIFSIKLYPYFKILKWKWKKKTPILDCNVIIKDCNISKQTITKYMCSQITTNNIIKYLLEMLKQYIRSVNGCISVQSVIVLLIEEGSKGIRDIYCT